MVTPATTERDRRTGDAPGASLPIVRSRQGTARLWLTPSSASSISSVLARLPPVAEPIQLWVSAEGGATVIRWLARVICAGPRARSRRVRRGSGPVRGAGASRWRRARGRGVRRRATRRQRGHAQVAADRRADDRVRLGGGEDEVGRQRLGQVDVLACPAALG